MSTSLTALLTPRPLTVEVFVEIEPWENGLLAEGSEEQSPGSDVGIPTTATWQHWFDQWLAALNPDISPLNAYELTLRLTNDQAIQTLNATYRQQDTPTDVLAFASLETDIPGAADLRQQIPTYLGDIIISVETAGRQRAEYGHSLRRELAWLAAHGLLHLLGWDHPDEASLQTMIHQQTDLLNRLDWD